jgi:hypothetical protein
MGPVCATGSVGRSVINRQEKSAKQKIVCKTNNLTRSKIMKKTKHMEEIEIFFLKTFNLLPLKGGSRCAAGMIADRYFYGGSRGEHGSWSHGEICLVKKALPPRALLLPLFSLQTKC